MDVETFYILMLIRLRQMCETIFIHSCDKRSRLVENVECLYLRLLEIIFKLCKSIRLLFVSFFMSQRGHCHHAFSIGLIAILPLFKQRKVEGHQAVLVPDI